MNALKRKISKLTDLIIRGKLIEIFIRILNNIKYYSRRCFYKFEKRTNIIRNIKYFYLSKKYRSFIKSEARSNQSSKFTYVEGGGIKQ